jgi:hypothetical protein
METKNNPESTDPTRTAEPEAPARGGISPRRRIMITIFVIVTVGAVLIQNMPDSTIKEGLGTVVQPYLNVTGLDQGWAIFSPNPRARTVYILARLERADGSVALRPLPTSIGPASYWEYRWRKYGEKLSGSQGRALHRPYAEWVVDQDRREGGEPVRITLVKRTSRNLPPGPRVDALPFVDEEFYTAPVSAR